MFNPSLLSFGSAFKSRRCLVMADGFYEWDKKGKVEQPYYVVRRVRSRSAFAGLPERWQPLDEGDAVESRTIVTTEANVVVDMFHDRMPAILDPEDFNLRLDPDVTGPRRLPPLLKHSDTEKMDALAVSREVNSPANGTPTCIEPVDGSGDLV